MRIGRSIGGDVSLDVGSSVNGVPAPVAPVSFSASASAAGSTVTFAGAPSLGQIVVVIAWNSASATAIAPVQGFNQIVDNNIASRRLTAFYRIAGASEPAAYDFTNANYLIAFALGSQGMDPIGNSGSEYASSVVSINPPSFALNISEGSMVFAAVAHTVGTTGAHSYDNGFANQVTVGTNRLSVERKSYSTADFAENCLASWSGTGNAWGLMFEIKASGT